MTIRRRLRSLLWRVPIEQEVREELTHHLELRTQELIDRGMNPEIARQQALARMERSHVADELTRLGRQRNESWARRDWLGELRQDLTFALRQCRIRPGFTLAAVLTLGLGIGATTAIFSVVHAVVLKPYAYKDPDRVLLAFSVWRGNPGGWSVGNFDYFRQRVTSAEDFAADTGVSMNLSDNGEPERIFGGRTTWNYFRLFGIPPAYGRTYTQDEDQPGRSKVVVLSDRLWRRRFGADPSIVGRSIRINQEPHDVIGIMPPEMDQIGDAAEAWVPIAFTPQQLAMYDEFFLTAYVRQRKDVTQQQVRDEFVRIAQALAIDHPELNRERTADVQLMSAYFVGDYRTRLFVLLAAVGLVLMIACGNVANLLLARLALRARELAIRAAIGAGRGRIVRQVLTESLVLALLGGAAGVAIAWWALPALIRLAPEGVPRLQTATLNGTVLAAAMALVFGCALFVGLLPAWQATRKTTLTEDLGDGKGALSGTLKPWMRQLLIAAQAALVMVVLAGAALLIRSSINLQQEPIGFDTHGVLSARIALPAAQYGSPDAARTAYQQVLESLQSAPGVKFAALDSQAPLVGGGGSNGLFAEGKVDLIQSTSHFISPGYFAVVNARLKAGRPFRADENRQTPFVMIINETLARAAFGDADPIGKRISCCEGGPGNPHWKTVVGVVNDIKSQGPAQPNRPEFYLPINQIPDVAWGWTGRSFALLTRGDDTAAMTTAIRNAVKSVDGTLPVYRIWTMEEGLRRITAQARFNTLLMSLLAATGLVLAALGIYSVIAWLVTQRTREIGVRMALGASKGEVVRMMSAHGLKPVVIGLIAGLGGAFAATRLLQNQLYEIGPRDPVTLMATALMLFVVAAAAAALPAWRATLIDPSIALRE